MEYSETQNYQHNTLSMTYNRPVLHILAVSPTHQRLGLGSKLIRRGLEAADKDGAQTFIEASPAGLPLYLKHGWEPVDELVIDMRPHGGEGIEVNPSLMREPNAPSKLVWKGNEQECC